MIRFSQFILKTHIFCLNGQTLAGSWQTQVSKLSKEVLPIRKHCFPLACFRRQGNNTPEHLDTAVSKTCLGITTVVSGLKNPCPSEQLYTAAIHHGELSFSKSFVSSENVAPKPKHVKQQQEWYWLTTEGFTTVHHE